MIPQNSLQLTFFYVEMDNQDIGKQVLDYFGVSGDSPRVRYFYTLVSITLIFLQISEVNSWVIAACFRFLLLEVMMTRSI